MWGSGGMTSHILVLGTGRRQVVNFTALRTLFLQEETPVTTVQEAGVRLTARLVAVEKRKICSCWELNPDH
jgi:hypothetical protein